PRQGPGGQGKAHHQSGNRPARFPDARPYRGSSLQGAARRASWLYPGQRHPTGSRAVAANLHKRHGVEVDPGHVVVVPGGKVTMFFAMLMFGEPGAEIIYPNPGFPIYESAIKFSGATAVPLPLREANGFSFSADELLS